MAHRGIITGLAAEEGSDRRRIVPLNPGAPVLPARPSSDALGVSAGATDATLLRAHEPRAISRARHAAAFGVSCDYK